LNKYVIKVNNLGKCYREPSHPDGLLWALRHFSLEILPGEVWGIIGANGAGKSTLLKLLSRVTRPSEGNFEIRGKVHSILELGMGFHAELTGIDNLYVAAALQGVNRRSIRKKLDSIIAFSGLSDAVYQPLRTYSSGMKVRLAFALAAHVSPDILILDEILAVGDETFQRKCFESIRKFIAEGVTVIFVSHDMKLISLICNKCILLENGLVIDKGNPEKVIESYSKIMGPSIMVKDLTLTRSGDYIQLFNKNVRITKRFGLNTSFRVNGIWYDPRYILWDEEVIEEKQLSLTGRYISFPLRMRWTLFFGDDSILHWHVDCQVEDNIQIDRFQANIMLNHQFSQWQVGNIRESFPSSFLWATGEDWTRIWIGGPENVLVAYSDHERFAGRVEFSSENRDGAMVIVSSDPEFKSYLLQYLKTWRQGDIISAGECIGFSGRIRIIEEVRDRFIDNEYL